MRYSASEKTEIIRLVEQSHLPDTQARPLLEATRPHPASRHSCSITSSNAFLPSGTALLRDFR
jgi:hypothetical protein